MGNNKAHDVSDAVMTLPILWAHRIASPAWAKGSSASSATQAAARKPALCPHTSNGASPKPRGTSGDNSADSNRSNPSITQTGNCVSGRPASASRGRRALFELQARGEPWPAPAPHGVGPEALEDQRDAFFAAADWCRRGTRRRRRSARGALLERADLARPRGRPRRRASPLAGHRLPSRPPRELSAHGAAPPPRGRRCFETRRGESCALRRRPRGATATIISRTQPLPINRRCENSACASARRHARRRTRRAGSARQCGGPLA